MSDLDAQIEELERQIAMLEGQTSSQGSPETIISPSVLDTSTIPQGMPVTLNDPSYLKELQLKDAFGRDRQDPSYGTSNYIPTPQDVQQQVAGKFVDEVAIPTALTAAEIGAGLFSGGAATAGLRSLPLIGKLGNMTGIAGALGGLAEAGAGAVGSEAGIFGLNQILQGVGYSEDTPIKDDLALATSKAELGTVLGVGGNLLSKGLGKASGYIAGRIDDAYNPERTLASAFDDGTNQFTSTLRADKTPLQEVTERLRADPVFSEVKDAAKGKMPFTQIKNSFEQALNKTGQQIDDFVGGIEGSVPYGKVIDPQAIEKRIASLESSGVDTSTARRIVDMERSEFARKILPSDDFRKYDLLKKEVQTLEDRSLKASEQASAGVGQEGAFKGYKPLSSEEETLLTHYRGVLDNLDNQIANTPLSMKQIIEQRRAFDAKSDWHKLKVNDPSAAAVYRDLADSFRDAGYGLAEGAQRGDEFINLNQRYQDLNRLTPLAAKQAEREFPTDANLLPRPNITIGSQLRPTAYMSASKLSPPVSTAQRRLQAGVADSGIAQGVERLAEGLQSATNLTSASGMSRAASQYINMGIDIPPSDIAPQTVAQPISSALQIDLNPPAPEQREGFQIPRNLNMMNPQGVANLFLSVVPEEQIMPIMSQWRRVTASGDRKQMAQMLGAVSEAFPDFPMQRGQVTGLPSEFDIGDGKARLFSPQDIQKWESMIEQSPLREDEKAQRFMALRKDGIVIPMDVQVNKLEAEGKKVESPSDMALKNLSRFHQFAPRERNSFGSRKVE